MNLTLVEKIANAVLYEGYILYPYRASAVKNRQRFNFGVLVPHAYSVAQHGTESWSSQTECLVWGNHCATLNVKLRFLHLLLRQVCNIADCGQFVEMPIADVASEITSISKADLQAVESLEVSGQHFQTWQEAVEREVNLIGINLQSLVEQSQQIPFAFPASLKTEMLFDASGTAAGAIVREQCSVAGAIELQATVCESGDELQASNRRVEIRNAQLFKVTARVLNLTEFKMAEQKNRDDALLHSLASAHTILSVSEGEFVSLLEPPEEFSEAAAACQNLGTWPVLAGEAGERSAMLSSPIILYDYPQIAPESAGDMFDGAEIDEILMLRILTLTDEEKYEMRGVDERARKILERTKSLPAEQFWKLHGAVRGLRPIEEQAP